MRPIPPNLLRDRLRWRRYTSSDDFGGPTYADPVTLCCYIEQRARRVMNAQGSLVMIKGTIIVGRGEDGSDPPMIDPKDEILLPPTVDEPNGEPAVILDSSLLRDPSTGQPHHGEVLLG